jgi:hypothetical protein
MSKITRKKRTTRFTNVPNDIPNHPNLSWKAKGLLLYLISRPDDWSVYVTQLSKVGKDGKEATANGLKELINEGYVYRSLNRDGKGKFKGYNYLVSDEPEYKEDNQDGKPVDGKAVNGKPVDGKAATTKKGLNKEMTILINDNKYTVDFLFFWDKYHEITGLTKSAKAEAAKAWKKLNKTDQGKAVEMIKAYKGSVSDSKYIVFARTYLSKRRFEDEFKNQEAKAKSKYRYKINGLIVRHNNKSRWETDKRMHEGRGYEEMSIN